MTKRLEEIFSLIPTCDTFADVGCDHGYIAKQMIKSGKCKKVIISDVSAKCLAKAEELLSEEIAQGKAVSVVSDGFDNLPKCDLALIAGMGGEEICAIVSKAKDLPNTLVLQPMKNSSKVRSTIVKLGYCVKRDFTFFCGRVFYDLMLVERGEDCLTAEEREFGRTNIKERPSAFIKKLKSKIASLKNFAKGKDVKEQTKLEMTKEAERLQSYVDDK